MNPKPQASKKHGQFILAMFLFLVAAMIGAVAESAAKVVAKSSTFQAEPASFLRSETLRPQPAAPVVTPKGIVVFSSRKLLRILDISGKVIKQIKPSFAPTATPAVADGKLFAGGKDGKFHCLDLETGKEVWANDLKSIEFSQPVVRSGLVIFQTASDRLIALDVTTGAWKWEYQHLRGEDLAVAGMCPPLVVDDAVYFGLSAGYVMAMDAASGRPIWKVRPFTGAKFRDVDADMEADAENLYVVSVGGGAVALSRKTGKVIWRTESGGLGGLRLAEGMVYLATEEPAVMTFEAASGKLLWTTKLKDKRIRYSDYPHRPVVVKGKVATVTRGGKLFVLAATDGKVLQTENYMTHTAAAPVGLADGAGFLALDNQGIIRVWSVLGQ